MSEYEVRPGRPADLQASFALALQSAGPTPGEAEAAWGRWRGLIEFIAAQPEAGWWVAEDAEGLVGAARVVRFGRMEELTELFVDKRARGQGLGRELLELAWPGDPTPDLGRVALTAGSPDDLSLYIDFGAMPVAGHWHMRAPTAAYRERRAQEVDSAEPAVHVLSAKRAVAEWKRLEPDAIGHERPLLHEFFGRDRNCLATFGEDGSPNALCWVSSEGDVGPAIAASSEEVVPVVLQALDRVAKTMEPENLSVFCTTISWWLLRRLRGVGFRIHNPRWLVSSIPLPGLDRYVPTFPAYLL